jgi:Dioxygenase
MQPPAYAPVSGAATVAAFPALAQPLQPRPTARPYPLMDFLRISPTPRGDIGHGTPGIPLTLSFELRDRRGMPVQRAAVYIWHHDPQGWTIDFDGDELDAVTRMRGLQLSDEQGYVTFRTVYPCQYRDGSVPLYLQIYLHDGHWVTAHADLCLLLPTHVDGPLRSIPLALPLVHRAERPRFRAGAAATELQLCQLDFDTVAGGLRGHVRLDLAT